MEKSFISTDQLINSHGVARANFLFEKKATDFIQYKETEKDLHAKIVKTRMMIHNQFPELSEYIDDLQPDPAQQNQETRLQKLRHYYDALNSLYSRYKLEYHLSQNNHINHFPKRA